MKLRYLEIEPSGKDIGLAAVQLFIRYIVFYIVAIFLSLIIAVGINILVVGLLMMITNSLILANIAGFTLGIILHLLIIYFAIFGALRTTLGKNVGSLKFGLFMKDEEGELSDTTSSPPKFT